MLHGEFQSIETDAITLVGGDFECAQTMHFQALQGAKIHRRFDGDNIARLADCMQA